MADKTAQILQAISNAKEQEGTITTEAADFIKFVNDDIAEQKRLIELADEPIIASGIAEGSVVLISGKAFAQIFKWNGLSSATLIDIGVIVTGLGLKIGEILRDP